MLSQIEQNVSENYLLPLTSKEKQELLSLPKLKLPDTHKNKAIPIEVDNSLKMYYPGIFNQSGLSCGQVACVGFGFTYEINRLRNLNASLIQNKYPTYFTWNWENGGSGWYGASYFHSLSVLKQVGNPNMITYGGSDSYGGGKRWLTGYDNYYETMKNRISSAYSIDCSTEEGILTLKHWISNHLEDSQEGGIGFFYSQYASPPATLPPTSPHAGEYAFPVWGSSPSHAYTVVGFNDSVRFDLNNDGQFTNDIDINGDGIVDIKDWEIGAFKVVNAYASPYTAWGLYSSFAKPTNSGGIWNNTVNVLKAIKEYSPALTYKVNMYYYKRQRIKIMAGISTNINDNQPQYYMSFPIIDNQGSDWGLQGEYEEEFRHLEFGLDVTPFLEILQSGSQAKFFFQVYENDPDDTGYGRIIDFSVMDYTGQNLQEHTSNDTELNILQNSVTTATVTFTPNFEKPQITTQSLPNADVYHNYSFQLAAQAGTPPYRWEFDTDYQMSETSDPLPLVTLPLTGTYKELPFEFEYFGQTYNGIYVSPNGYLSFTPLQANLPYNSNNYNSYIVNFENRKIISAFNSQTQSNVFYYAQADSYIVRWVGNDIDVSLKLNANGEITIFYNNCTANTSNNWVSGISNGDFANLIETPLSGKIGNISNVGYVFFPAIAPDYFNLNENGLLTGIPTSELVNYPLNIKIIDAKGLVNKKTIPISTEGMIVNVSLTNNANAVNWGTNSGLNLIIKNVTETQLSNVMVKLSCDNTNVSFANDTYVFYLLNPGQEIIVNPAFYMNLNYNFYNNEEITIHVSTVAGASSWNFDKTFLVYTADISLYSFFVDDSDNNALDIGETTDVAFTFKNIGAAHIGNFDINLTTQDQFLSFNQNLFNVNGIEANQSKNVVINFTVDDNAPSGHIAILNFHISDINGYQKDIATYLSIGQIFEDWETGDFSAFNWSSSGNLPWNISQETPFEGNYCLKSGNIGHNSSSVIEFDVRVLSNGEISFYRKVSCEDGSTNNWDYLVFLIDNQEMMRWDGELDWAKVSFPVQAGNRNFKWIYKKDVSVSAGMDAAWIDLIKFPPLYDPEQELSFSPNHFYKIMPPNQMDTETLIISNTGGGLQNFRFKILSYTPWLDFQKSILNSDIICDNSSFYLDTALEWVFTLTNRTTDSEWIKEVGMDFPQGFIVDSLSPFIDSSNDTLNLIAGELGNSGEFRWYGVRDNINNWGMISNNETASVKVFAHVDPSFEGNLTINYSIYGDIYGSEPHNVSGNLNFINLGFPITWISTDFTGDNLGVEEESEVILEFNSNGMPSGEYSCSLAIYKTNDTVYVPVILIVDEFANSEISINEDIRIYPNPATNILFFNKEMAFEICDIQGRTVLKSNTKQNRVDVSKLKEGLYFIKFGDKTRKFVKS